MWKEREERVDCLTKERKLSFHLNMIKSKSKITEDSFLVFKENDSAHSCCQRKMGGQAQRERERETGWPFLCFL